jgi:hypothetical protein
VLGHAGEGIVGSGSTVPDTRTWESGFFPLGLKELNVEIEARF